MWTFTFNIHIFFFLIDIKLELAGQVAGCLGIIKTKAEYFCSLHKPSVNLTPTMCIVGRSALPRKDLAGVSSLKRFETIYS